MSCALLRCWISLAIMLSTVVLVTGESRMASTKRLSPTYGFRLLPEPLRKSQNPAHDRNSRNAGIQI